MPIDVYGLVILQLVHGVLLLDAARANAMIQSLYVFAFEAVIVAVALTIRFARRWYKAHREPVQVASQAALTAAACCLLARPLAATLPAAGARSMFWFARCVFAEMLGSHAIMFVMRFWIAVPLRVALTTLAAVSLPTACGKFRPVFPLDAGCWAGGLALQWGVGFALPMSIIWALERRSRRCFSAQAV